MAENRKPRARRATKNDDSAEPTARRQKIAEAAYYKAEKRGFVPGNDQEDWYEAEREIDGGSTS